MGLKINGSTDGSIEVDVPASCGSDLSVTLPATAGEIVVANTSGDVDLGGLTVSGSAADDSVNVDSSGRLLVGTSSVSGDITIAAQGNSSTSTGPAYLQLRRGALPSDTQSLGWIQFADNSGNVGAQIYGEADQNWTSGSAHGSALVFASTADGASGPTERMRIRQDGAILWFNLPFIAPSSDNAVAAGGGSNRFSAIWAANGTIQTSDERAKTEITDANLGSEFVKALRPVSYKWIEGGKRDTGERDEDNNYVYESVPGIRTHWGFIAQEVKQAIDAAGVDFGGWILTDKDDPDSQQALRYDQFIAPLTKALQEALERIETLEASNAAVEARLTALEGGAS